ncbi:KIF-binding protein-like [Plodia interpunctella]|uniref:KIF-binding protein-like n=1 Tax=Plodia interpunctella TaxID=58824 RepID=UPI00236776C4|nr:KIF-binding protein-like [Plodia interpunctella]XP_053612536.1 KIF-binding protein-like [Plodia interpunctella]
MLADTEMTEKEIINDFKENYGKVRKLLDEDSKNDPENEPYLSKYKAKNILTSMRDSLKNVMNTESNLDQIKLLAMQGAVLLNVGIIDMETEDFASSEKGLMEAEELLAEHASKPEIVTTLINVYNNLGILWSNRDEPEKAKSFLLKAKELYEGFKCTLQMPLPIDHMMNNAGEAAVGDFMLLEKAHTLTLYYLAQVYGSLKENLKSAVYCHVTLRRQLQYSDYEPIDWALNSATLSQFFAEQNGFYQSRHHLAAASTILDTYEDSLSASGDDDEVFLAKLETLKHRSADVARCWAKYCLLLMTASKARLMNDAERMTEAITDMSNLSLDDSENICGGNMRSLIFPDIDVKKYENKISDKFLLTYQDAREVFLCCQTWLNKAKEYYKLDSLASDYVELVQDSSQSYSYLAFFEEDDERRSKMHKRRIDMLEELIKEINPTYYLQYCRQLWYELGEVYSDILNIKLDKLNNTKEKPTPHALKKVNMLCEKSIENYDHFLNSVKDKNGMMPSKVDVDLIRPVISAYAFIGRNSMKRIAVDKNGQLINVRKSYESYNAVVEICSNDPDAAAIMHEEFSLCTEMVKILPIKIKRLETEALAQN